MKHEQGGLGLALAVVIGGVGIPAAARADGAFPDSNNVLVPPDRPKDIVLATNFGLISTNDAGATWEWSCETALTAQGQAYQLGAPAVTLPRIVAASLWGVVRSDDASCTWQGASGEIDRATAVTDVFVQSANPMLVYALAVVADEEGGQRQMAFASSDGGATFGPAIFNGPEDGGVLGVESAASDPRTIYVSFFDAPQRPRLAVTHDAAATWTTVDLEPTLGSSEVRIVAVDPNDANTIFLRASGAEGDRLVVSRDGGDTLTLPFRVNGALTAFLRRKSGTILIGGVTSDSQNVGARSTDGGSTFIAWPGVPHLRALAERDGLLYAAADNFADRFALGVSSDETTWRPLLSYNDVTRVKACVAAACLAECRNRVDTAFWSASVCDASDGGSARGADANDGNDSGAAAQGGASLPSDELAASCSLRSIVNGNGTRWSLLVTGIAANLFAMRWRRAAARRRTC